MREDSATRHVYAASWSEGKSAARALFLNLLGATSLLILIHICWPIHDNYKCKYYRNKTMSKTRRKEKGFPCCD